MEQIKSGNEDSVKANPQEQVETLAKQIVELRQRPFLILFFPDNVAIREHHVNYLFFITKRQGLRRKTCLSSLDVLIQTMGGDPISAYRIAQIIRNVGSGVEFLVPEYAYSAGTLMTLSGDKVLFGENAVLSPFDIRLVVRESNKKDSLDDEKYPEELPDDEVELVGIDHFIQIAKQARIEIEKAFRQRGWSSSKTDVESQMLREMVEQVGALTMAQFYRERNVAQAYASELLENYMFKEGLPSLDSERILRRLIVEAPSHEFPMDYHLCIDAGLKVEEMNEELSDKSQELVHSLDSWWITANCSPN